MAYTKYSLTPANNNAAPPDGAPEGMLPSAVNDTMRDMMAQIRDCGDGIRGGTYTMTAPVITGGSINGTAVGASTASTGSFTSLTDSGNLTFTGTGNRITGDFSNGTLVNRVSFQTSTTNSVTGVFVLPNGTSTNANINLFNNSDPTNAAFVSLGGTNANTDFRVTSGITGTGTYLPLTMYTGGSERLRIDTSGNVGIGTATPAYKLDTRTITAATTTVQDVAYFVAESSGATTSGFGARLLLGTENANGNIWPAGIAALNSSAGSNLSELGFYTATSGPTLTERMRIDSSGNLLVGLTSATYSCHQINKGTTSGATAFVVGAGSTGIGLFVNNCDQNNYSAAAVAFGGGRASSTGRSINVGGTVNALGTDYAEYMVKNNDFTVNKGDLVGIDVNGKLTNIFSDAISFVVKSTNPSYVGGDVWGSVDIVGQRPSEDATQEEKDAFEEKLENARKTVDRIAFSGQVPVNVIGATAGQYIIPVNNNGAIKGQAISNPTFEQYQIAVGKVISIESDGRAKIIVKVA